MPLQHGGKVGIHQLGQKLGHELHQACFQAPEVSKGFSHLNANSSTADHHDLTHLTSSNSFLDLNGLMQIRNSKHAIQFRPRDGQDKGESTGSQHELIIREFLLFTAVQILHLKLLVLPVDCQGLGPGKHLNSLGISEKGLVTNHVKAGGAQLCLVRDISPHIIGNTATSVGYHAVLIHYSDIPARLNPFQMTGSLGASSNSTDNDDFFAHNILRLYIIFLRGYNSHKMSTQNISGSRPCQPVLGLFFLSSGQDFAIPR